MDLQDSAGPVRIDGNRPVYSIEIKVNGISISSLVIDPHYEIRHRSSVSDELILGLVNDLDQGSFLPEDEDENGYQYFVFDSWMNAKSFRLIWMLPPGREYLGVVNAYRRRLGGVP